MTRLVVSAARFLGLIALIGTAAIGSARADTVYLESYSGESSYPTNPEIDTLGMGGLYGSGNGGGAPSAPTLTGVAASAEVVGVGAVGGLETTDGASAVSLPFFGVAGLDDAFTVTGEFDNFDLTFVDPGDENPYVARAYFSVVAHDAAVSYWVAASLEAYADGTHTMGITEYLNGTYLARDGLLVDGLVEGVPFDLDLVVDPVSSTALARFKSGTLTASTATISLSELGTHSLDFATQLVGLEGSENGTGARDRVAVDFTEFRVDVDAVPEASLAWMAALALGTIAMRRR